MAANFPGPWQVRFNYTINLVKLRNHQHRLNFDVTSVAGEIGEDFTNWIPEERDGDAVATLDAVVDAYVDLWKVCFANTLTIVNADLYKYAVGTHDATWYSTKAIATVGTHASANRVDAQQIFTFRTTQGGIMRASWLEGNVDAGDTQQLPLTDAPWDALADYFVTDDVVWIGRDNGYPIAFLGFHPGENERLFKDSHR